MLGVNKSPRSCIFYHARSTDLWRENRGPANRLQWSSPESLILVMLLFLQTFFGLKTAFQNCKWFQKLKHFRIFFSVSLHAALWRLIEPFHFFLLSSSSFQFSAQPADSTIFLRQTCLSDQSIRSAPDQTATPDHQIRLPHQTTDHHPWLLKLPVITAYPTYWNGTGQVHSLWVGWRGVYRALNEPCKAYFPHTFGLNFPDFFVGLT